MTEEQKALLEEYINRLMDGNDRDLVRCDGVKKALSILGYSIEYSGVLNEDGYPVWRIEKSREENQ